MIPLDQNTCSEPGGRRNVTTNTDPQREALLDLATALIESWRYAGALRTLNARGIDAFLSVLASWAPTFEKVQPWPVSSGITRGH
jgi:hypothetical protein